MQVEVVGVEGAGDIVIGPEGFDPIGFSIVIEIVEAFDSIAAHDVDELVDDANSEGFEQAGGEAFPLDMFQAVVEPANEVDIATVCGDDSAAIVEEVEGAGTDPSVPRIFEGDGDRIEGVAIDGFTEFAMDFKGLGPAERTAVSPIAWIDEGLF